MNFFIPIGLLNPSITIDVNGDDKLDIIAANYLMGKVRIFLNTGTGIFNEQANYLTGVGSGPRSVTTADVDGNNKADIIVTNSDTKNIGVFLNTGNGTFNNQVIYPTRFGFGPISITTADVDGDKTPDVIVTYNENNAVGVLFNTGNGTFNDQIVYSTANHSNPMSVIIADVDGNNKPDIIVANYGTKNVGVFLNKGNGTFNDQVIYPTGFDSDPVSVTIADVDGDKKPDIIVTNQAKNTVGVFFNTGNGSFTNQVIYSTGSGSLPEYVTANDVDGDEIPDIIVVNHGTKNVGVFLNKGNGTFNDQVIYPTGIRSGGPICFTKRDIDGNHVLDSLFAVSDTGGVRLS